MVYSISKISCFCIKIIWFQSQLKNVMFETFVGISSSYKKQ